MNRRKRAEGRSRKIEGIVEPSIVLDEDFDGDSPGVGRRRELGLHLFPLCFVAPILEPDLHLSLGEFQPLRQIGSFRSGQVALMVKAALELEDLSVGKSGARPLLPGRSAGGGGG